jgi:hypothetical protein
MLEDAIFNRVPAAVDTDNSGDASSTSGLNSAKSTPIMERKNNTSGTNKTQQLPPPNPSMGRIAACFVQMAERMSAVYLPYCSQHDHAIETLALIRKTHPVSLQRFLDDCKLRIGTKLDAQDYLIKPVQSNTLLSSS